MTVNIQQTLAILLANPESEVVEFKEAKNDYDFSRLGKYFSALSNEANLNRKSHAWLVFGVKDKDHSIVGSYYRSDRAYLDSLKGEIAKKTTQRITFNEIHEHTTSQGRVILFEIPAAPKGMPVSFDGHYYGRDGEELSPLNIVEIERIRAQVDHEDWSAGIIAEASMEDLDDTAIAVARTNFKNKFPDKATECDTWDTITFLNKTKLTNKGQITRTAILLLGKDESSHFVKPADPIIRWLLKDSKGHDKDYQLFGLPWLLAVDKVFAKIRNLKYRYLKDGTLFPEEVDQYEPFSIREALNNCIAHQDYTCAGRINVVELEDQLVFTNLGNFVPDSVERVVIENSPEEQYRNRFLANAMFNLKMVDTAGGGIRKMFEFQSLRFFPMPEYEITDRRVKLTLTGKVLDIDYARLLSKNSDLSLTEIIALDKVQKQKHLTELEAELLRKRKLIEGRKPNFYLAKNVAQATGNKAAYSKNRAFDKQYYLDLILKSIKEHGHMDRKDLDQLLWNKLPEVMDDEQRKNKVTNLIAELRRMNKIENVTAGPVGRWALPPKPTP